ncbi:ABC transporter permease, partial [Chloroflexota bacterium]
MQRYIFRRFLQGLLSLFVLTVIIFLLVRISGDPVELLADPDSTPEQRDMMRVQLGLDKPWHVQYYLFISDLSRGDLGDSIKYGRPAGDLFFERLPNTMKLAGVAFLYAILLALPLGIIAGSNRGTRIDTAARLIAVLGIAVPSFWMAIVFMDLFAVRLGWLPAARIGGWNSFILPATALGTSTLAGITRMLRSSMVENMDTEWVKLAKIKGVSRT